MLANRLAHRVTFLTCIVLGLGRWITQIWLGPIPLIDFSLQMMILVSVFVRDNSFQARQSLQSVFTIRLIFKIILLYVSSKIVIGLASGLYPSNYILRDEMAFFTLSEIPILMNLLENYCDNKKLIRYAELGFVTAGLIAFLQGLVSIFLSNFLGWNISIPVISLQANVLSIRSDQFIIAISPIIVSLVFYSILRRKTFLYIGTLLIFTLFILWKLQSRAVLISMCVCLLISFLMSSQLREKNAPASLFRISMIIIGSPFALMVAATTQSFQRLVSGFGINVFSPDTNSVLNGAIGTQFARTQAWNLVMSDWHKTHFLDGYPAGYHFIQETGAVYYLSGSTDVRWPHNFLISCIVRNGIFIGSLIIFSCFALIFFSMQNTMFTRGVLLDWQILSIQLSTLIVSCLGVVMESPFGYIPFTFASAFSLARYKKLKIRGNFE